MTTDIDADRLRNEVDRVHIGGASISRQRHGADSHEYESNLL